MKSATCYLPQKGLDDRLSDINWLNKYQVSLLRSLYFDLKGSNIEDKYLKGEKDFSKLSAAHILLMRNELKKVYEGLKEKDAKSFSNYIYNPIASYVQLDDDFTPIERENRRTMVASMFSDIIDKVVQETGATRQQVITGYKDTKTNEFKYGPANLVKMIGDELKNARRLCLQCAENPNGCKDGYGKLISSKEWKRRAIQYGLTYQNLGSLIILANRQIADTEGICLAAGLQFAVPDTIENFDESGLAFEVNIEEQSPESYQQHKDNINPFVNASVGVKRLLASLSEFNGAGGKFKDDLGRPKRQRPSKLHVDLLELLCGCKDEQDILNRLSTADKDIYPYASDLIKKLKENPLILTEFYVDFSKNSQLYAKILSDGRIFILNRKIRKAIEKDFIKKLKTGSFSRTGNTIYTLNTSGAIITNTEKVNELLDKLLGKRIKTKKDNKEVEVRDSKTGMLAPVYLNAMGVKITEEEYRRVEKEDPALFVDFSTSTVLEDLASNKSNKDALYDTYEEIFEYLGLNINRYSFSQIISNPNDYHDFIETIKQVAFLLEKKIGSNDGNFLDLITGTLNKTTISQQMSNLHYATMKTDEVEKVVSKFYYQGKSYFSYVMSSRLGDFRDALKACYTTFYTASKEEASKYIDNALKDNPLFYDSVIKSYKLEWINKVRSGQIKLNLAQLRLKLHLLSEYGSDSFFYNKETDTFNVKWLNEMYNENVTKREAVSRNFNYFRLLGDDNFKFDSFSEQPQTASNIMGFFKGPRKGFGYFPTFILGDSGIQKYITAKIYKEKEIIDGLVQAAYQDIELYKEIVSQKNALEKWFEEDYYSKLTDNDLPKHPDVATQEALRKKHKETMKAKFLGSYNNISTENIFALVPMLNTPSKIFSAEDSAFIENLKKLVLTIANNSDPKKAEEAANTLKSIDINEGIRKLVEHKLKEGFDVYCNNLSNDGLFDQYTTNNGFIYKNKVIQQVSEKALAPEIVGKRTDSIYKTDSTIPLYSNLWDFFINSKFAMLNQVELMVKSPAFFKDGLDGVSVDFQKRYKMIHTNGYKLSADATWSNGEKFSDDFTRTAIYINDPNTDTRDTNPEFYNALVKYDEINGTDLAKNYIIEQGSNVSKGTKSADGQSWITYTEYMKIMGMSGKMTPELEALNKRIIDIRNSIKEWQKENPWDTSTMEARLKEIENKIVSNEKVSPRELLEYEELREKKNGITMMHRQALEECNISLMPIKSLISGFEEINNDRGRSKIPYQIKHSECVVFPELLPIGSKLRDTMQFAEDNNIGMVSSTESVKVGLFGAVDIQSVPKEGNVANALQGAYKHKFSYSGYIIQQNNTDHINQDRAVGTQGRKIIFANLNKDGNYESYLADHFDGNVSFKLNGETKTNINGTNINQLYTSLIAANIIQDTDKFCAKMSDPEVIRRALIQSNMNSERGTTESFYALDKAGFEFNGKIPDFIIPLFEGGNAYDNSAYILSIFRKMVNHQSMAGGSAIQASAYGLTGYDESENLKFQVDPNNPANILYAETEIPFDLHYTDSKGNQIPLNFNDWCESDGSLRLSRRVLKKGDKDYNKYLSWKVSNEKDADVRVPLIETVFPGILDLIVSRIPTEEKYSMMPLKVTKFTSKVAGGGIIRLPLHTVTIAGFDFDIDKLYIQRKAYKYKAGKLDSTELGKLWLDFYNAHPSLYSELKFRRHLKNEFISLDASEQPHESRFLYTYADNPNKVKKDFSKWLEENDLTPEDEGFEEYNFEDEPNGDTQTRIGRDNLMFELMYNRLLDYETMKDRFTPGGFTHIKDARKYILGLKGLNPNTPYDYSDPYTLVLYNQQNQIAGKLIGVFANHNANAAISSNVALYKLSKKIAFGNHIGSNGLDDLKSPDSLIRETLAAAVDAVKEPCFRDLNITNSTAGVTAVLARLGFSYEEIGLLLNQPVINSIIKKAANENRMSLTSLIDEAAKELDKDADLNKLIPVDVTTEELVEAIECDYNQNGRSKEELKSPRHVQRSLQCLRILKEVCDVANEVNANSSDTKFTASNSVTPTYGGMYAQESKVEKHNADVRNAGESSLVNLVLSEDSNQNTPIELGLNMHDRDYMKKVTSNPFGWEQVMFDAIRRLLVTMDKYYPYEEMHNYRSELNNLIKGAPTGELIDSLHKNIINKWVMSYCNVEDANNPFNPKGIVEYNGKTYTNYKYYTQVVPEKLAVFKAENPDLWIANPLLNMLTSNVETEDDRTQYEVKFADNGSLIYEERENATAGWKALVKASPELRVLAEELYMLNYYKSGTGFGVVGFNHLAPSELKLVLAGGNYIRAHYAMLDATYNDYNDKIDNDDLIRDFVIQNKNNYQVVFKVNKTLFDLMRTSDDKRQAIYDDSQSKVETITINPTDSALLPFMLAKGNETTPNYFRAGFILNVDGVERLYVCDNGINFNDTTGDTPMTYRLVETDDTPQQAPTEDNTDKELDFGSYNSSLSGKALIAETKREVEHILNILKETFPSAFEGIDIAQLYENRFGYVTDDRGLKEEFLNFKKDLCASCSKVGYKGKIDGKDIC